ncbi:MAG: protein kinase [Thermoanaerobaculia bacterium]
MALETGSKLGPYEILGLLGAGGMGEVYKARDERLDRTVAIKVLPSHLSESPEVKQRFDREARLISSLSHPHICTLFDVGHEDGVDFLVMEHLEGETLAQRLEKGPLPLAEVLRVGIEMADALDRAHKSGVVHRDLKPGNLMMTNSGVKLLDFGLAKNLVTEPQTQDSNFSRLLTETPGSAPLTVKGTILGTFQYMAPEQIEGQEADARSDIFALGAVLYEALTGLRPFGGKTQASLIGSIMHSEPESLSKLSPMAPPALHRVIQTCLAKNPDERWNTVHDVKLQLQWIEEGGSEVGVPVPVAARRKSRERIAWGAAALAVFTTVLFAFLWAARAPEPAQMVRFDIGYPDNVPIIDSPKVSPDGRMIVFSGTDDTGRSQIWLRSLNALEAQPIPGTEGSGRPFWSPDSRYLGFFANGKLKKIPVGGGPPQVICDAPRGADGSWSEAGVILYDGAGPDPIMRVPSGGGIPVPQIEVDPESGDIQVGWPQFLPGGEKFLYVGFGGDTQAVKLASLKGGRGEVILAGQSRVEYTPPGFLIYVREDTLVSQPFDVDSGKITGEPTPLAEDLNINAVGLAHFSVSRNGVLAFRGGEAGGGQLQWVDREGELLEAVGDSGDIYATDLSPDGRWLAMQMRTDSGADDDIWVRDLVRGVTSRFTFNEGRDVSPVWTPDGRSIAYAQGRDGQTDLAIKAFGGSGEVEYLLEAEGDQFPSSWSPDGKTLLYYSRTPETGFDVWVLSLEDGKEPKPFVNTPFVELDSRFSPNGRWVAYSSNESGQFEVYVQEYPGPGGKWQISTAGGREPVWGPNGKELFYRSSQQSLMRVEVDIGEVFEAGIPQPLFSLRLRPVTTRNHYLLSRDGERFLLLSTLSGDSTPPTTVVLNWSAGLGH